MFMQQMFGSMMLFMVFIYLIGISSSVFLAFAVYYDARIRSDSNAVLWAVLSGFFNIVALVYLIVKLSSKPKPVCCIRCRNYIPPGYAVCPYCGTPLVGAMMPPSPEEVQKYKKRRLVFFILFIVLFAGVFIATFFWMFTFMQELMDYTMTVGF